MEKQADREPGQDRQGTLLLLHGGGPGVDAASNWSPVLEGLSRRFHCVAPDLLGFGNALSDGLATTDLHGPAAWARQRARHVLDLMDREGLAQVMLLGNSAAGGAAALALMELAPDRVERTVVMGGAGTGQPPATVPFYDDPTQDSMQRTLGRLVADEVAQRDLLDQLVGLRLANAQRSGAEVAFRSMFEPDPPGTARLDLASIACPVLALHGEHDRVSPVEVSVRLADTLPGGRLQVVEGAGHWIHVDRPATFCRLVEEFCAA